MWPIGVGMWRQWCIGMVQIIWNCSLVRKSEHNFIGVLKEEEKKKEKDNQYKLKKAMATALA